MHGLLTVKCNIKEEHYFLIQEFYPNTLLTIGVTYTSEWRAKSGTAILLGFTKRWPSWSLHISPAISQLTYLPKVVVHSK